MLSSVNSVWHVCDKDLIDLLLCACQTIPYPIYHAGARQKTSGRVCFICDDPDHIRPNCPHLLDCHLCLRPGHIARNCTALVRIQRDNGKQGRIANLTTNVHGFITVTARVGKEQSPFLVDTGADVSLLSYDVVEANRLVMQRQVARRPLMVDGIRYLDAKAW